MRPIAAFRGRKTQCNVHPYGLDDRAGASKVQLLQESAEDTGLSRLAAWATRKLGTNADDLARFDPRQGLVDCSDQRPEVLHSIRPCPNYNNAEGDSGEVVLEFKLAIHRQQRVDQACRAAEQLAVLHASPTQALDRHDVMLAQLQDQVVGKILVKQYAHWPTRCRVRAQARQSLGRA